jgi:hypothetical protein
MKVKVLSWIFVLMMQMVLVAAAGLSATVETCRISLKGTASGGQLFLADTSGTNARYVQISTSPGEPAESVVRRLADRINQLNPFSWAGAPLCVSGVGDSLEGLLGPKSLYFLAGTEKGLGIPHSPLSLSCSYDPEKDEVLLRWEKAAGGYDSLLVLLNWSHYAHRSEIWIPGTSTSLTIDRKKRQVNVSDLDVWVIGYRDEIPSNAAGVRLEDKSQDERYGIPFFDNIAPGWRGWLMAGDKNGVAFEQGVRAQFLASNRRDPITHPATKPFYQVIKTKSSDAKAGVWRKFVGLTPDHSYSISARLSTLEMDLAEGDWAFSLHAAYNKRGGGDLSVAQLAGLVALPDGNMGDGAGRVAIYKPGLTTKGTWEERSTGKEWRGLIVPDITLPAGVDAITVWVRCGGSCPTEFGTDWVKLEDLGPSSKAAGRASGNSG